MRPGTTRRRVAWSVPPRCLWTIWNDSTAISVTRFAGPNRSRREWSSYHFDRSSQDRQFKPRNHTELHGNQAAPPCEKIGCLVMTACCATRSLPYDPWFQLLFSGSLAIALGFLAGQLKPGLKPFRVLPVIHTGSSFHTLTIAETADFSTRNLASGNTRKPLALPRTMGPQQFSYRQSARFPAATHYPGKEQLNHGNAQRGRAAAKTEAIRIQNGFNSHRAEPRPRVVG